MDLKLRQWYGYERWACKCHSRGGGWSHKHDGIAQNIPEWEAREIGKKEEKWERGKEWEQKKKKERQSETMRKKSQKSMRRDTEKAVNTHKCFREVK